MLKGNRPYIIFSILLVIVCVVYYHQLVLMYPAGIHAWAQADRLSLAINFYDRGMNFFKPATNNLYATDGITGVEFPIQSYLAAALGHIFGRGYISTCFRTLNTIISCAGLFFLFLNCYRQTKDFIISLLPPFFIFTSPVYVFYTCNYLPDTAAASIAFIAFYFMPLFYQERKYHHTIKCLLLLTLATLIKTSVGLYFLGFAGIIFLLQFNKKTANTVRQNLVLFALIAFCITAIASYYFYNVHLNETYHSGVFLASTNPFKSIDSFLYYYRERFCTTWIYEYLLLPQYFILVILFAIGFYLLSKGSNGKLKLLLALVYLAGVVGMLYFFGEQLWDHDYYIISIFLPFAAYVLLITLPVVYSVLPKKLLVPIRITIAFVILFMLFLSIRHLHNRLDPVRDSIFYRRPWASYDKGIMDALHIPKNERIAVANDPAPNLALVYLDRRGYHIPPENWQNNARWIKKLMDDVDIHIFVCEGALGKKMVAEDSVIRHHFIPLALREHIAVFRKK